MDNRSEDRFDFACDSRLNGPVVTDFNFSSNRNPAIIWRQTCRRSIALTHQQ
jgi:hypothetical protein